MAQIVVIGCGYVGAVSACCFAELGHNVECIDIDPQRVQLLSQGRSPIHEPGLDELLSRGLNAGRLSFRNGYPDSIDATVAFIAVNTPGSQEGAADLRAVRDAVSSLAPLLPLGATIVNKSTVPIGTGQLVAGMAARAGRPDITVVSNPEFLREGSAIHDFMNPDRIVLGSDDTDAISKVAALYDGLGATVQRVDIRTAEMVKYASNAFLATKISFINEMAAICDVLGADVTEVAAGMGMDSRIGSKFLNAGLGWGGSCFPKDVRALAHMASVHGTSPQLLRSVIDINSQQRLRMVQKLRNSLGTLEGATILILGAAFKGDTDDTRHSPALELANLLSHEGVEVRIFDPVVTPQRILDAAPLCEPVHGVLEGAEGCDALVIATEWREFAGLDFAELGAVMKGHLVLDTRNFVSGEAVRAAGLEYRCVGRPSMEGNGVDAWTSVQPAEVLL